MWHGSTMKQHKSEMPFLWKPKVSCQNSKEKFFLKASKSQKKPIAARLGIEALNELEVEIKKLYDYIITEKLSEYIIPSSNYLDLYFYNERTKKYNKSTNLQINLKNLCFYEIIDIKNMNGNIPIMSKNNAGIFNCSKTSMKGYPNISYIVIK